MKKLISSVLIIAMALSMVLVSSVSALAETTDGLPDVVDLSTDEYFPPIKSQGDQGSCVAWSQAYYQFTHEMNKALGRKTTEDTLFSPSFVYNMSNYGEDTGCFPKTAYENMKRIGVTPWSTIPYNKEVHNDWFAEEKLWQEAAQYRIADYKILPNFRLGSGKHVEHPDDPDLAQIKTLLSEGHVLSFGAYMYRWKENTLKKNPACPENDKYAGELVVVATSPDIGTGQGHRMTLVGYNDNIWVDINNNNSVDKGEMGAFKVANSFNTWWKNDGFIWMAYDNINLTTSVEGGLPYRTMSGVVDVTKITVLPYNSDADIYIRYTLNTCDRQNLTVKIKAEKDGETFETLAGPYHEAPYAKNIYSFDGTTNSNDGTMIFMLSNVVPGITSETLGDYKWSIEFEDKKADSKVLTVKNAEVVDLSTQRAVKAQGNFGYTLDGSSRVMTFPEIPDYIPPVTTTAPETTATTAPISTSEVTTAPVITDATETVTTPVASTPATTEAQTTPTLTIPTEQTTSYTDPTEPVTETEAVITIPSSPTEPETTTASAVITTIEAETTATAQITTAYPTAASEHIYGDTNSSGNISISDATLIQKFIAFIVGEEKINLANADCNSDGKVSVKDATCIQKYLAKLDGYGVVGEKYTVTSPDTNTAETTEASPTKTEAVITTSAETVNTTETAMATDPTEETSIPFETTEAVVPTLPETTTSASITTDPAQTTEVTTATTEATEPSSSIVTEPATTEPVTTEPATTEEIEPSEVNLVTFTNSFGWQGTISCYYWSDSNMNMTQWPGVAMENAGTNSFGEALYTLEIPKDATYVIFTNGSIQTVDIPYKGGEQKFYPVSPDSGGKYTVENW